ncbi:MAG: hypothetical protein WBV06_08280, partial [Acidimicrobiia bacterium]
DDYRVLGIHAPPHTALPTVHHLSAYCAHRIRARSALPQHRSIRAHAAFFEVFKGISERVESEGVTDALAIETQQEVSNRVRDHIIKIDTKLRPCVAPLE